MTVDVAIAAVLGTILGVGADRLSARWPDHADGSVRAIDWRTVVVIGASALSFGALASVWTDPLDRTILGIYIAALMVLLATDLDQKLLPDLITFPLAGYALVVSVIGLNPLIANKELGLASALGAAVALPIVLYVTDRVFKGALGMGDLKLAVSLGLMSGISRLFVGFIVGTTLFAAVVLVLLLARRLTLRTAIPFGPALIAAGVLAALV